MMRTLRDKKTMHLVLWILIFAFVIGFVFIAVGTRFQGAGQNDPNLAAKVGKDRITLDQVNQLYEPALNRMYGDSGESPTQDEVNQLRQEVLDQLIDTDILNQTAKKLGLSVSDDELAAAIQRQPYFRGADGKFDKDRYLQVLAQNQITPDSFEQSERQQLLIQKLETILADSVVFSGDEVDHYADLLNRELKADYVALDLSHYETGIHPSTDELKSYYESNKSQYDHPERAKCRHILLTLRAGASPTEEAAVKKTLEDYRRQILSGKATFADLAKKYSQDPGSSAQGGELGWVTRGTLVKEFEDQIFDHLKKGQISEPFKTQFGYHLVQLEDYEHSYTSTFDQVRSKVLDQYKSDKAQDEVTALARQLAIKLKNKESLAKAAGELSLKSSVTPWFTGSGGIPGIAHSSAVTPDLAELYVDDWKGPLPIGDSRYYFQITQAKERPLSGKALEKASAEAVRRLGEHKQDLWVRSFLDDQRKKLKVKTYLN